MSYEENLLLTDAQETFELLSNEVRIELMRGETHLLGSLEDEFFWLVNSDRLGSQKDVQKSKMFERLMREVKSVLRRKSILSQNMMNHNTKPSFDVTMVFSNVYKIIDGSLIVIVDLYSEKQSNTTGVLLRITPDSKLTN